MFKLFNRRSAATGSNSRKKQLWGKEFDIVDGGLDEKQVADFVNGLLAQREESVPNSVRSILRSAIEDAEKITGVIKQKARAEASEEAERIIARSRREVGENAAELEEASGEGSPAVSAGDGTVLEETMKELTQLSEAVSGEKAGPPVQNREEATGEAVVSGDLADTGQLPGKDAGADPVTEKPEGAPSEPAPSTEKSEARPEKASPQKAGRSLYTGEVDITVDRPVDPSMVAKLYNYLQTTPEIKFVRTSGSWDRGTTIVVSLDKPIALVDVLSSKVPEAEVVPESLARDGFIRGKKGVRGIRLSLKKG